VSDQTLDLFHPQEKRKQQMQELERQILETEQEQQALAATASKQHTDLMDKIRMVMNATLFITVLCLLH